jgi:type II restriction enzyme
VVSEGAISLPAEVRERYHLARKQVEGLTVKQRGWRLDVLRVVQSLGKAEFTTTDAYIFERELEQLHPDNRHVRDKIRQQLQVLRDTGLLLHVERGIWRLP